MALHYIYKATQITFNWICTICTNHHWEKQIWFKENLRKKYWHY